MGDDGEWKYSVPQSAAPTSAAPTSVAPMSVVRPQALVLDSFANTSLQHDARSPPVASPSETSPASVLDAYAKRKSQSLNYDAIIENLRGQKSDIEREQQMLTTARELQRDKGAAELKCHEFAERYAQLHALIKNKEMELEEKQMELEKLQFQSEQLKRDWNGQFDTLSLLTQDMKDMTLKFHDIAEGKQLDLYDKVQVAAAIQKNDSLLKDAETTILNVISQQAELFTGQLPPQTNMCVVCMEATVTHLLSPCGHYSFCQQCASLCKECPICRKKTTSAVHVYNVSSA